MTKPGRETDGSKGKTFDLEDRTLRFAKACIDLCRHVRRDVVNREIVGQMVRSAGSVGANYREANDAMSKKEFFYRIGICRKEAKETMFWIELLAHANPTLNGTAADLIDESSQLAKIFSAIHRKRPQSPDSQ